jgi:hypothetical protein
MGNKAFKFNRALFPYIHNKTKRMSIFAFSFDRRLIAHIPHEFQTVRMCQESFRASKESIKYLAHQTEGMCLFIIGHRPHLLHHIRELPLSGLFALKVGDPKRYLPFLGRSPEIDHFIVSKAPSLIKLTTFQNPKMCEGAVKANVNLFQFCQHKTEEMSIYAVKCKPSNLKLIDDLTKRIVMAAAKTKLESLSIIEDRALSKEIVTELLRFDMKALKYLTRASLQATKEALEEDEELGVVAIRAGADGGLVDLNRSVYQYEFCLMDPKNIKKFHNLNKDVVKRLMNKNTNYLEFLSESDTEVAINYLKDFGLV